MHSFLDFRHLRVCKPTFVSLFFEGMVDLPLGICLPVSVSVSRFEFNYPIFIIISSPLIVLDFSAFCDSMDSDWVVLASCAAIYLRCLTNYISHWMGVHDRFRVLLLQLDKVRTGLEIVSVL